MKIKEIKLERDLRENNILERDLDGNPIKFKQSEFVCKLIMDDNRYCVIKFEDLIKALRLICENEDYKYPNGLGRKMPFYAYIYPLFKDFLLKNGFKLNINEFNFSIKEKRKLI